MLDDTLVGNTRFTGEERAMIVAYYAPELGRGLVKLRREHDDLGREQLALIDQDGHDHFVFRCRDGSYSCSDRNGAVLAESASVLGLLAMLPRYLQRALALA